MGESQIKFVRGIPEAMRQEAAQLYDDAFGEKFAVAISSRSSRIELLATSLVLEYACAAICDEQLVGLAGFHVDGHSLTGGLNYQKLISHLGFFKGNWAALIFSIYERKQQNGELLMDGIAVRSDKRGKGIGTKLLEEIKHCASEKGMERIRLEVIDTNPQARQLYERNGFVATETSHFGFLRSILGFGASTTMEFALS